MENALTLQNPQACISRHQSVLLIDDNPHRLECLAIWLEMANFSVLSARSAADGMALASQRGFDLILISSHLAGCGGAELCRQLRTDKRHTQVLLYSSEYIQARLRAWSGPLIG